MSETGREEIKAEIEIKAEPQHPKRKTRKAALKL